MAPYISFIGDLVGQIFNFTLPWGIAFGSVVVGIFGAPLIVKAYKKFF